GLHTNGYTLARRIVFDEMGLGADDELPGTGRSVADELLAVHRSYLGLLSPLLASGHIRALAHITGGGIPGNLPRVLPEGLGADVDRAAWPVPPVFRTLQEAGRVERGEMDHGHHADAHVEHAVHLAATPRWIAGSTNERASVAGPGPTWNTSGSEAADPAIRSDVERRGRFP